MRVHQDREAAARRPVDRSLRARRHPYRRMRLLIRLGQHLDIVKMKMLTGEAELLVGPGLEHYFDSLAEARSALLGRHPKGGELDARKATPRAPIDPAAREQIE